MGRGFWVIGHWSLVIGLLLKTEGEVAIERSLTGPVGVIDSDQTAFERFSSPLARKT